MATISFNRLPVIVLTGFLGSGKTTLLNRLLNRQPRSAVLINEFGSTPVDQQLIAQQDIPLMTLSGGCLCCQVRGALAPVLKNLWMAWSRNTELFERVIIEASGVASPEPILDTLLRDRWLATRFELSNIICTLAVPNALTQLERYPEARAQAAWADALIFTQADLACPEDWGPLRERLREIAPTALRMTNQDPDHEIDGLLHTQRVSHGARPSAENGRSPDHSFQSLSLYLEQPKPWLQIKSMLQALLERHPEHLVRIKGVVYLPEEDQPLVVHAASGRLYPPTPLPTRPDQDRRGRLVFIHAAPAQSLAEEVVAMLGTAEGGSVRLH